MTKPNAKNADKELKTLINNACVVYIKQFKKITYIQEKTKT